MANQVNRVNILASELKRVYGAAFHPRLLRGVSQPTAEEFEQGIAALRRLPDGAGPAAAMAATTATNQ